MKTTKLLETLSDIIDLIVYAIVIVNICIAIFHSDWTRGIFFLLVASFVQNNKR
jgi:hypothetical protein